MAQAQRLLAIEGLKTHFATDDGMIHAVDGVDLAIDRGETVGVVGESGCGKTVTAMTVLKLVAMPPGRIVAGRILWQGRDLVPLVAPLTLVRHYTRLLDLPYLRAQTYLAPHPKELALRNHV